MLARLVAEPFHQPGWAYEEKYDGFRILAYKEGAKVTLRSRNDLDRTRSYPEIAAAIGKHPARTLLLDGEAVAFDSQGISRFQLLQQGRPAAYAVFDLLYENGNDLRKEPLSTRRNRLEAVVPKSTKILLSRRLAENGFEAYRIAKQKAFEGLVAKDLSSPYVEGRSNKWLKVKVKQEDEFIIVGYTAPSGAREYFGAILLGAYKGKDLVYVGKVGTGFSRSRLASLFREFRPLVRKTTPLANPPREKDVTYLQPKLVGQIAYEEWTADGKLRQPVFLGLREDKKADEVVLPGTER
jgi:bifunctional non-homologous end joining protein LigD